MSENDTIQKIYKRATELKIRNGWRWGQSIFNATYDLYPEFADNYRGSTIDPFHNDANVEHFLAKLEAFYG